MTKLLNLNQLSPKETREVQIGDRVYAIKEMSVEDFIETTKVAEAMETETSYAKQLHATIGLVKRSVPDIEESLLLRLSLEQLRALTAFVRGEDPERLVNPPEGESGNE
jgi:hypothetical protein